MAVTKISNGNVTFTVRNEIPGGTWGSASFNAIYLADTGRAQIDARASNNRANFTKAQLLDIAANLTELAATMPDA